jgi:hypothetical protein
MVEDQGRRGPGWERDMFFFGSGLFGLAVIVLWIYAIFDVISSEDMLVRNLPRTMWLIIVIILPTIGAVAWLALGRPLYAGWRPGDTNLRSQQPRVRGPEDREDFGTHPSSEADRLRRWEEDLRRREAALPPQEDDGESDDDFPFKW